MEDNQSGFLRDVNRIKSDVDVQQDAVKQKLEQAEAGFNTDRLSRNDHWGRRGAAIAFLAVARPTCGKPALNLPPRAAQTTPQAVDQVGAEDPNYFGEI